ncbi:universal stress protein [Curtobacterium sp. PhB115]|uniref:universal stress protein n=1 Tax=Curtobacterium sp. PhB115 TaxID=2485173 RepID=UPI000F4C85D7|nr:universal stress protein [Curtobacterium sp. PhB115]ROP58689.1 nucleotide-binding universal stress UspA family protein [Curtobacterium sp. PhB115]
MAEEARPVIVAGLQVGDVEAVATVAAQIAHRFNAALVCVTIDPSLLSIGTRPDGSEMIEAIDPDSSESTPRGLPDDDIAVIQGVAARYQVPVENLTRVGDPARMLAAIAEERQAELIVVGTRTGRHRMAEFFNGSVAARLTHQQHRPVLVVPTNPVGFDAPLPWQSR